MRFAFESTFALGQIPEEAAKTEAAGLTVSPPSGAERGAQAS